ncbi:MAG: DUF3426 domain-containing protein [Phyllobacteriaceae bacterium]|nr:DUF3426 domain-containing protein [Phyllobacteriaceae bacterium]
MRTTCPTCETAYTIPDDRIGPKGRKVRCARCGEEWRVAPPDAAAPDLFEAASVRDESSQMTTTAVAEIEAAPPPPPLFDTAPPVEEVADAAPVPVDAAVEESVEATPARPAESTPPARPARKRHVPHLHLHLPTLPARVVEFGGPVVFVAACLCCLGLVVLRADVVARLPGLAGLYRAVGLEVNLRGIVFGPIATLRETEDGKPVLVVEGTLTNTTGETRAVPALRFALRDDDTQELYAWSIDPRATTIAAGDRLRFRTRLVAPPERAADLQVRFAERRNRQAGLP